MSLANVSLVGNLVRTPELIQFSSGRVKTTLVLAVNGPAKNSAGDGKGGNADFYKIETWGKLAELSAKYLSKGNQVSVAGKLSLSRWIDKNGTQRITPTVEANQLSLPPKPKEKNFAVQPASNQNDAQSHSQTQPDDENYLDGDDMEDAASLLEGKVIA